jgi:hypothetical protein
MGWRDIISSPDPSRALYLAMRANPTASRAADVFQGGFEGAMEGLGNIGHVATIPTRALAGASANLAGTNAVPNVAEYALHGGPSVQYGDLLAGTMEDAGELKPGSFASKVLRLAGNTLTDPTAAPAMLSGAEAVGALAGRLTPSAPPMEPTFPRRPVSRLDPAFSGAPTAPGQRVPLTSSPEPLPGRPGGPVRRPGVVEIPRGPSAGPDVTQAVPMRLQGTGEGPVGLRTQEVPRFSPSGHGGWTEPKGGLGGAARAEALRRARAQGPRG